MEDGKVGPKVRREPAPVAEPERTGDERGAAAITPEEAPPSG